MLTATEVARKLITRWEGFRSRPYLCPASIPTIGYGFTRYEDGSAVTLRDPPMTRDAADALLLKLITTRYMPAVQRLCPLIRDPERLGAIVDFCFNLGATNLRLSTLRKRINAGDWDDVPHQLRRWVYAGGRKLAGLIARREAEIVWVRTQPDRDGGNHV